MIKTHTAQSLAKYLGKKVLFEGQAYFLEGIHIWTNHGRAYIFKEHQEQIFLAPIKDIYPILKDEESPTGYVDLFGYVCEVER